MIHKEVRERMVAARKRGLSVKEIQRAYGYGKTAIYELFKQERETGSIEPKLHTRGVKPRLGSEDHVRMRAVINEKPDITLEEVREALSLPLSISQLSRIVRVKLGYTYKKRWCTLPKENGPM
jgi:putative transposase